jgi:hypothetical protein
MLCLLAKNLPSVTSNQSSLTPSIQSIYRSESIESDPIDRIAALAAPFANFPPVISEIVPPATTETPNRIISLRPTGAIPAIRPMGSDSIDRASPPCKKSSVCYFKPIESDPIDPLASLQKIFRLLLQINRV